MFGNKNLLSEGVQASAIVLSAKGYGLKVDGNGYGSGYTGFHLELEVHFTDGTTTTISRKEKRVDTGVVVTGQIVPVRYDENDHSKVEVDTPAMKAHRAAASEATRASSIARAHAELADPAAPGPTAAEIRNRQPGDPNPTWEQIKRANRTQ